ARLRSRETSTLARCARAKRVRAWAPGRTSGRGAERPCAAPPRRGTRRRRRPHVGSRRRARALPRLAGGMLRSRAGGKPASSMRDFDVIVIGGGHAGAEAALAAARMGARTACVVLDPAAIGRMSCNPAIGGIAKGQLVREIDALGGEMGLVADASGIQFRMLNTKKGPAVRSPRAQCDRHVYNREMARRMASQPGLTVIAGEATELLLRPTASDSVDGVRLADGRTIRAPAVVLTTGTFLGGRCFAGSFATPGGRIGESAATKLSESLRAHGLRLARLKTGTPARLCRDSI